MSGIVIGGECQIPYHSKKAWGAFLRFIYDVAPHEVVLIGDFIDCPSPSRWNRGTAAEYAGQLQLELNFAKAMLTELRTIHSGRIGFHIGNHEDRINVYARTKAPAFADLECLEVSSLLDFKEYGIEQRDTIHPLGSGTRWVTTHGHVGPSSRYSGGTALALARRFGRSVVCGHTHRLGVLNESSGIQARTTLSGVESGHLMDVSKASYIKHQSPNWQAGFAYLDISPKKNVWAGTIGVTTQGELIAPEKVY